MFRNFALCLLAALFMGTPVMAQEGNNPKDKEAVGAAAPGVKELSGMSIVGNDEAPKSLYIVPWKSSEIGVETSLGAMLNEGDMPVDRDVFKRQVEFYRISRADTTR